MENNQITTKELFQQVSPSIFYQARRKHGWQYIHKGLWPLDTGEVTLQQWLTSQSWYNARDVVKAIGLSKKRVYEKVAKHGLVVAPVSNGKWQPSAVALLLEKMGIKTECPDCKGMAVIGKDGAVTCLECGKK